jgi:hypothetical protein
LKIKATKETEAFSQINLMFMESIDKTRSENETTTIQLVQGNFNSSDALHLIINLINEKINFHKIQRHQNWEGNHADKNEQLEMRIKELENEKVLMRELIKKAKEFGFHLKINGTLEISFIADSNS